MAFMVESTVLYFANIVIIIASINASRDKTFSMVLASNRGLHEFILHDNSCNISHKNDLLRDVKVFGLGAHISRNLLFWIEERKTYNKETGDRKDGYQMSRAFLVEGTLTNRTVIIDNVDLVSTLRVDWIYDHLYWVDNDRTSIKVASFDGNSIKTIYKDNSAEISDIALDPREGWMYVAFIKPISTISRIGMDGFKHEIIFSMTDGYAHRLVLDLNDHSIFWIDKLNFDIKSAYMDGSNVNCFIHTPSSLQYRRYSFGLSVNQFSVIWSDFTTSKINWSCRKSRKSKMLKIDKVLPRDHVVFDDALQPPGCNYCNATEGASCPHLCLPSSKAFYADKPYSCRCPDNSDDICIAKELTEQFESLPKCRRILKTTSSQCSFPACSVTGDFKPLQCDILNGLHSCWCTDKSGTRVPGTLMTAPEEPDCINGTNLKQCVFMLLQCRNGTIKLSYEPVCNPLGEFQEFQCDKSSCWCVDENGEETGNTKVPLPRYPTCKESFKVHFVVAMVTTGLLALFGMIGCLIYRYKFKQSLYTEFIQVQTELYSDFEAQYEDISDLDLPAIPRLITNAEYAVPQTLSRKSTTDTNTSITGDSAGYLKPNNYLNGKVFWQKVLANAKRSEVRKLLDLKRVSIVEHNNVGYAVPRKIGVRKSKAAEIYADSAIVTKRKSVDSCKSIVETEQSDFFSS